MNRAIFNAAVHMVLDHEGGESVHPDDRGGPTKFGISQRWHPDVDLRTLTRERAIEIYWEKYWQGRGYDLLPASVAVKVFDLAVNMGRVLAGICLQRALRACGASVTEDGEIGPKTAAAAASVDPLALLAAVRSEAAGEYRRMATLPGQRVFERGWLNRAYS